MSSGTWRLCLADSMIIHSRWGAGPYVGHHLPPIMVLLSSSVRQSNAQPLKLQALEGWQALVKALSKEAPHQLADVADQVTCS